jgi:hypothetical protein
MALGNPLGGTKQPQWRMVPAYLNFLDETTQS